MDNIGNSSGKSFSNKVMTIKQFINNNYDYIETYLMETWGYDDMVMYEVEDLIYENDELRKMATEQGVLL